MNLRSHAGRRRLRLAVLLALAALLLLAAFARQLCPFDPYAQDYAAALLPPGPEHPLGTDRYGRDMLSRVLMGGQVSIFPHWRWWQPSRCSARRWASSAAMRAARRTRC